MNVYISGSSGLIGSALKKSLEADQHTVTRLPRIFSDKLDFKGVDAVIHLAGEGIASGRWNADKKRKIEESRVKGTTELTAQLAESPYTPSIFITASAIGYYGDRNLDIIDESSSKGTGFLSDVCARWEMASLPATKTRIRTVNLRTGIVLSKDGGALKQMLPPFRLGGGGIMGSGKQYMSWISLDDMIRAIRFIVDNDTITGPVNLVSPNPVTNYEFTKILGGVLHKPTVIPLPAWTARLIFGEMADALLLSSTRVIPKKLLESGFTFKHDALRSALEDILT